MAKREYKAVVNHVGESIMSTLRAKLAFWREAFHVELEVEAVTRLFVKPEHRETITKAWLFLPTAKAEYSMIVMVPVLDADGLADKQSFGYRLRTDDAVVMPIYLANAVVDLHDHAYADIRELLDPAIIAKDECDGITNAVERVLTFGTLAQAKHYIPGLEHLAKSTGLNVAGIKASDSPLPLSRRDRLALNNWREVDAKIALLPPSRPHYTGKNVFRLELT